MASSDGPDFAVSIHTPAKGATPAHTAQINYCTFRSTPPRRGRRHNTTSSLARGCFDPHPREGGDTSGLRCPIAGISFDPHPREGGDVRLLALVLSRWKFRSTPPRRGDTVDLAKDIIAVVSIHTPAKGATAGAADAGNVGLRFDPHPREGGDASALFDRRRSFISFDPHPREGGDARHPWPAFDRGVVSIHTPAKGATEALDIRLGTRGVSIHTPAKGATPKPSVITA